MCSLLPITAGQGRRQIPNHSLLHSGTTGVLCQGQVVLLKSIKRYLWSSLALIASCVEGEGGMSVLEVMHWVQLWGLFVHVPCRAALHHIHDCSACEMLRPCRSTLRGAGTGGNPLGFLNTALHISKGEFLPGCVTAGKVFYILPWPGSLPWELRIGLG